jgi:tetratricopeptide (TPR) repeat protein
MVTAIVVGNSTLVFAQEVCPVIPPDEIASMTDVLRNATINRLHLQALQISDPTEKIACYDQILKLDPKDTIARTEREKAQQQLEQQVINARKGETKQALLQAANDAIAADDETALKKVLGDLEQELKTSPADKELSDARQRVQSKLDQHKVSQQVRDAIKAGHDAYFTDDSAQWTAALRLLNDALKIDPTNAELNSWKQKIESQIRKERFLFWLKVILLVATVVGVIVVGLYLLLRKRQGMLEFADGDRMGEIFRLDKPAIKIGALTEGNDLVVADPRGKISRYHCEIVREGRRFFIKDGSTNGTWVNEEYLEAGRPKVLRKGDRLTLAGEVTFIFRLK